MATASHYTNPETKPLVIKEHRKRRKNSTDAYASTPYTQIPDGLWLSEEFNALSPHSRCLFTIFIARWDPFQPKRPFAFTYDEIQRTTKFNRNRISSSIKELMTHGFIERTIVGRFPHNATLYKVGKHWFEKKYPKKKPPLPGYLRDWVDGNIV
jgi:hypothetical protein